MERPVFRVMVEPSDSRTLSLRNVFLASSPSGIRVWRSFLAGVCPAPARPFGADLVAVVIEQRVLGGRAVVGGEPGFDRLRGPDEQSQTETLPSPSWSSSPTGFAGIARPARGETRSR